MLKTLLKDKSLFRQSAFIGGKWSAVAGRKVFDVFNPADGSIVASVSRSTVDDANEAVAHAKTAGGKWASLLAAERSSVLMKWYELMLEHQDDLALLMTTECGKPLAESRGEIGYAASFLKWYAEEGKRSYGDIIPQTKQGTRIMVLKQPIGVAALITPWNFPSAMITRKAGPALAAGCSVVCKPSEDTPLSALALAELGARAGVPEGVFNVIVGARDDASTLGDILATHPDIRKLSFTGSTEVAKALLAKSSTTMKRVSLGAGGNAPFIVFEDADLDQAINGLVLSKFRNAGQTCVCSNRIYVQNNIYDDFVRRLKLRVEEFVVGVGTDPSVTIGPMINSKGVDKARAHVIDAVLKGATIITGGGPAESLGPNFFQPTVLTNVTPGMRVCFEETFGPVAPLIRFDTEEEVVAMANDTRAGLAAYFYTKDLGRSHRVAEELEYGMVGVNEGVVSTEVAPFGGIKESGLGREGSAYGLDDYLELKYVLVGGI
eukprot:Stramenopile-MAST_4_protein_961